MLLLILLCGGRQGSEVLRGSGHTAADPPLREAPLTHESALHAIGLDLRRNREQARRHWTHGSVQSSWRGVREARTERASTTALAACSP